MIKQILKKIFNKTKSPEESHEKIHLAAKIATATEEEVQEMRDELDQLKKAWFIK